MDTTTDTLTDTSVDPSVKRLRRFFAGVGIAIAVILLYTGAMVGLAGH